VAYGASQTHARPVLNVWSFPPETRRLARALPFAVALALAGCVHSPAAERGAGRELHEEASGRGRSERRLVTGSRIPRPIGRDGQPETDSPVRVYWRDDVARAGDPDLARVLWRLDVDAR
jgi:hypothetical protein